MAYLPPLNNQDRMLLANANESIFLSASYVVSLREKLRVESPKSGSCLVSSDVRLEHVWGMRRPPSKKAVQDSACGNETGWPIASSFRKTSSSSMVASFPREAIGAWRTTILLSNTTLSGRLNLAPWRNPPPHLYPPDRSLSPPPPGWFPSPFVD